MSTAVSVNSLSVLASGDARLGVAGPTGVAATTGAVCILRVGDVVCIYRELAGTEGVVDVADTVGILDGVVVTDDVVVGTDGIGVGIVLVISSMLVVVEGLSDPG